jgi:hypothetical protein
LFRSNHPGSRVCISTTCCFVMSLPKLYEVRGVGLCASDRAPQSRSTLYVPQRVVDVCIVACHQGSKLGTVIRNGYNTSRISRSKAADEQAISLVWPFLMHVVTSYLYHTQCCHHCSACCIVSHMYCQIHMPTHTYGSIREDCGPNPNPFGNELSFSTTRINNIGYK